MLKEWIAGSLKRQNRDEYALYRYCFTLLMPICYRHSKNREEAVEWLQLAFIKIMQNLQQVNPETFDAWAKTIQINTILDIHRKNNRTKHHLAPLDANDLLEDEHGIDWNEAEARLNAQEIKSQIDKLPDSQKLVINLFVFEGFSHQEISKQLGISEATSRWHLMQARQQLKRFLKAMFEQLNMLI